MASGKISNNVSRIADCATCESASKSHLAACPISVLGYVHRPMQQTAMLRPGILRRAYDWTTGWAHRPGGTWALFLIAVIESSVFPVPPDVLLIALAVGAPRRALWFAAVCSVGSVVGGVIGWVIGSAAWHVARDFFIPFIFSQEVFDRVQLLYQGNAFLSILTAAFTPIPFKVFTVAAGVFDVNLLVLIAASGIGRSARFFMVGGAIYLLGPQVKEFIEKYFDWLAWAFLAIGIAGFVAVKYLR
jgi:membrane protein YqaA with SNARE-associated domain